MSVKALSLLRTAAAFAATSFLWSVMAFVVPQRVGYPVEYSGVLLAIEIGGHILFGLAAGLASFDLGLAVLCGAESILIDTDHILSIVVAPVLDRTAHSVFFLVVASLFLARLTKGRKPLNAGVLGVTISAVLAHLSFDIFTGYGSFPILFPFNYQVFAFPYPYWLLLEVLAVVIAWDAGIILRRSTRNIFSV